MNNTPGPWQARRWIVRVDESMGSGFELYGDIGAGPDEVYLGELDCSPADGRLIEAAPELLKVLRDLMDAVEKYTYGSLGEAEDAARELIARIDGGDA